MRSATPRRGKVRSPSRNFDLAANLGRDRCDVAAPRVLPIGEPARDAHEARPPERARLRIIVERGELVAAKRSSSLTGSAGKPAAKSFGEVADRAVDDGAAIGGAGRRVDGVERREPQDVLGVDGVGIAQPVLDLGDREPRRPRGARRLRRGPRRMPRRSSGRSSSRAQRDTSSPRATARLPPLAGDRGEPLHEARRHRRRAARAWRHG